MNQTLRDIVARELKKIDDYSKSDAATLSPDQLEALEILARILAKDDGEDPMPVGGASDESLLASVMEPEPITNPGGEE